jgi:hypothetical protein
LSNKSYKIIVRSGTKEELKKKLDALLKSANISEDYKKLLPAIDRRDIYYLLASLADKKGDKIKGIIQITIRFYLKNIAGSKNFYSDFNFIKSLKSFADDNEIIFKESDWEEIVTETENLMKSSSIDVKLLFLILEDLFEGSRFLTAYRNFSAIETEEISDEYISLCFRIFDHNNWVKRDEGYKSFNSNTKNAIIKFLLQEAKFRQIKSNNLEEIEKIGEIINKLNIKLKGKDLKPLIINVPDSIIREGRLSGSIENVSGYFEMLEYFYCGLPQLAIYKEFSKVYTAGERFSNYEYVTVALKIFDTDNWTNDSELNGETKNIIKEFVMQQAVCLLPDAQNRKKISRNRKFLETLGIVPAKEDIEPFIEAVESSPFVDCKNREIKNGQAVQNHFEILSDFLGGTDILGYYRQFAEIITGQFNFSDFHFVTTALKIMNHRNWRQDVPDAETCQKIKKLYFDTFLDSKLSRDDKVYNLDILHNQLKITITEQEKNELGGYVKYRIEGLVDLVDMMEELVVEATNK